MTIPTDYIGLSPSFCRNYIKSSDITEEEKRKLIKDIDKGIVELQKLNYELKEKMLEHKQDRRWE